MAKPRDDHQKDLLRPALEAIIDPGHPLVRLAREIDWGFSTAHLPAFVRRM
jgi:IS5 family transposase